MNKKELVVKYRSLVSLACRVHNLRNLFRRQIRGKGNRVEAPCALLKKVDIRITGNNNRVIIEDFCTLQNSSLYIRGNNCTIFVGKWSTLIQADLCTSDDNSQIRIGQKSRILGKTHMAAIEGTSITIGEDCLFSSDIQFRTGDSHSVLDLQGCRINPSQDIVLGDHVWVGTRAFVNKGAKVASHSIIGACALVTKAFAESHCALAGVPAKIVKHNVDWSIHRVPVGEAAPDFIPPVTEE